MATRDTDYTKTGNGWLTSVANKMSFVPFLGPLSGALIMIDTGLSAIGWAFRGKFVSAAATLGAGTVGATSAFLNSNPIWWGVNVISGITTGRSVNTHARALTENATSMVTRPLGMQPTVLRSYYAGVGGVGGAAAGNQRNPGYWATRAAQEKGLDPQSRYDQYRGGDGADHLAALEASRAQVSGIGRA